MTSLFEFTTSAYDWRDDVISDTVIRGTCAKTHLYSFCIKAMHSYPIHYKYNTSLEVAQKLIQMFGWQANEMWLNLERRVGSDVRFRPKDSFIGSLKACQELYNQMYTVDYYSAARQFSARNFKVAEQRLLMAYKRAQDCENGFHRIGRNPYVFLEQNKKTFRFALVAAGATHSLYN